MERLHAIITGRVQGVGYRAWTVRQAIGLGLVGWVRNQPNSTVETVAEGPRPVLDAFLTALHDGPPAARVDRVLASWHPAEATFGDFSVRY